MQTQQVSVRQTGGHGLFDRLVFGIDFTIMPGHPGLFSEVRTALLQKGVLAKGSDNTRLRFALAAAFPAKRPPMTELNLVDLGQGLKAKQNSSIEMNAMRLIRSRAGTPAETRGLDGNDNLIGAVSKSRGELFEMQLQAVEAQIILAKATIQGAIQPGRKLFRQRLWLREVEFCRDLPVADAVGLVRQLQRAGYPGAAFSTVDIYRAHMSQDTVPVVRYVMGRDRSLKIYPKTETLVRVELAVKNRAGMKAYDGDEYSSEIAGRGAVALMRRFAANAQAALDEVADHVMKVVSSDKSVADLLIGILPILQLADGLAPKRGRPPGTDSQAAARAALEELFQRFQCSAQGQRKGTALWTALELASGPSGPLIKKGGKFILRPEFIRAAAIIAGED